MADSGLLESNTSDYPEHSTIDEESGEMQLSFRQLETALCAYFRIAPDKTPAFRARLKQMQRLGFPPGVNVGRGPRVTYSGEQYMLLVFALKLVQLGLTTERAVTTATTYARDIKIAFGIAHAIYWDWYRAKLDRREHPIGNPPDGIFALVEINHLAPLQLASSSAHDQHPDGTAIEPGFHWMVFLDNAALAENFRKRSHRWLGDVAIIDVSLVLFEALKTAQDRSGVPTARRGAEFDDWADDYDPDDRLSSVKVKEWKGRHGDDPEA